MTDKTWKYWCIVAGGNFSLEAKRIKGVVVILQSIEIAQAFALAMIGVFSEDYYAQYITWSVIFFVGNMLVQIIASIALPHHPLFSKALSVYGFGASAFNVIFVISGGKSPAIEWVTVFMALGFVALAVTSTIIKFRRV
nr:hypothetical protein [Candidatus Sigynarchaeum springense]